MLDLVRARTVDLLIPAESELIASSGWMIRAADEAISHAFYVDLPDRM
jgi:hypothetical protein